MIRLGSACRSLALHQTAAANHRVRHVIHVRGYGYNIVLAKLLAHRQLIVVPFVAQRPSVSICHRCYRRLQAGSRSSALWTAVDVA